MICWPSSRLSAVDGSSVFALGIYSGIKYIILAIFIPDAQMIFLTGQVRNTVVRLPLVIATVAIALASEPVFLFP